MKTKKRFKWMRLIRNIILSAGAILLLVMSFNWLMTRYEHKQYPAWGRYVEVKGKNMHVYTKGMKGNTIVMLPGLGTAAPVLDFEPLINELSRDNKVVVAEPFGYGWSDLTDEERTVDNIVEELRSALRQAGIEGRIPCCPTRCPVFTACIMPINIRRKLKRLPGLILPCLRQWSISGNLSRGCLDI
jgi:hypothetical protein